jgi:hypothetical protein
MKHIRMRTITVYMLAGLAGALLLRTSQSVQIAEDRLVQLKTAVAEEQDSIRLLNAEWAYLNNPERLEKLASRYLDLMPPQPTAMLYEPDEIPAKLEETPSSAPPDLASLQTASLESSSPPKSKSPSKNFNSLLKKVSRSGNQ